MRNNIRKNIIIAYESYQNNGYINSYFDDSCFVLNEAYWNVNSIYDVIYKWEHYNDFSEYMLYYSYTYLTTYVRIHPLIKIDYSIDRFTNNFLENNPFIFIDEGKEINLYHLLMLLVITNSINDRLLGKILTRISIRDIFSYVSYIHETRLKGNFDTIIINHEYVYLMLLLSDYCLAVCRHELSLKYKGGKASINALHCSIIDNIKNNAKIFEVDKYLIEIYTEHINLIDEYFIGKIDKSMFKKWFYNKTYYHKKPCVTKIINYIYKFNNDYFDGISYP